YLNASINQCTRLLEQMTCRPHADSSFTGGLSRFINDRDAICGLGSPEERGVPFWVGYDIDGVDDDLSDFGLLKADDLSDDELRERGIKAFTRVAAGDQAMHDKLGIARKQ